jgi:hypothetical protein
MNKDTVRDAADLTQISIAVTTPSIKNESGEVEYTETAVISLVSFVYLHIGQGLSVLETFRLDRNTLDSPVVGFIRIQNIEDV